MYIDDNFAREFEKVKNEIDSAFLSYQMIPFNFIHCHCCYHQVDMH